MHKAVHHKTFFDTRKHEGFTHEMESDTTQPAKVGCEVARATASGRVSIHKGAV